MDDYSKCPECGSELVNHGNSKVYECESGVHLLSNGALDFFVQSRECLKRVVTKLRTENAELKRLLEIETKAHEISITWLESFMPTVFQRMKEHRDKAERELITDTKTEAKPNG